MRNIKYHFRIIGLLIYGFIEVSCKNENSKEIVKPNFLVIIADDAGWNDVGYNGSEIRTPNIDRLAKQGVQLHRFYVNPTCSPTRLALLTGIPSSRLGIVAPISGKSTWHIPDSIVTLPHVLKQENYESALFGKWHLGLDLKNGPKAYGFDYAYGFLHGQIDQYSHEYKNGDPSWYRNDTFITEAGHTTDLLTKETIDWLTSKRDTTKNFYIQLAYSAPHFPLQEEEKWKAPYLHTIDDKSRRDFAAAMSHMDASIGTVLESIKTLGLEENTLVLFMSDNGAMEDWYPTTQYNGRLGPNPVLGSNVPLRDWKTSNYEGAIRVPAVIYWKNHLEPAKVEDYLSVIDVMPTVLSLAKGLIPDAVEGKSIWSSVLGSKKEMIDSRPIYVRGHLQESIMHQSYKLIRTRHADGTNPTFELYNLDTDPEEQHNMIDIQEEKASTLKAMLIKAFLKDAKHVNKPIQ